MRINHQRFLKDFLVAFASITLAATWSGQALAQANSQGPIKLVVPFAPGGGVDIAARLIGKQLSSNLGTTVIVENRAGASGTVGGKAVQTAAADGQHCCSPPLPMSWQKKFLSQRLTIRWQIFKRLHGLQKRH